jgi:hypothetical protein
MDAKEREWGRWRSMSSSGFLSTEEWPAEYTEGTEELECRTLNSEPRLSVACASCS